MSSIDDLAALIETQLGEDEATALAAQAGTPPPWKATGEDILSAADDPHWRGTCAANANGAEAAHIVRHDPGRALAEAASTRKLAAEILAIPHEYVEGDEWYSCAQAPLPGEGNEPGSGCSDEDRRGGPCDCGRDSRVEAMLRAVAERWETGPGAGQG